jgi:hypothetical protein
MKCNFVISHKLLQEAADNIFKPGSFYTYMKGGGRDMIFEARRMKDKIDTIVGRIRTGITDEFLETVPKDSKLYQAYFMGKEENSTVENVTADLLEFFQVLNDTELTMLLKLSKKLLEKANA